MVDIKKSAQDMGDKAKNKGKEGAKGAMDKVKNKAGSAKPW